MIGKEILLEKCYNEKGKYMGKIVIQNTRLTPEFLDKIKKDKDDKMGWKQYHEKLKKEGFNI